MSFRTRLTGFFVLIVVVPMIAVGFLVFRLIGDSEQGKADARVTGISTAAAAEYRGSSSRARLVAEGLAGELAGSSTRAQIRTLRAKVRRVATQPGIARVTVSVGPRVLADAGSKDAVAPGSATTAGSGTTVAVSELTAAQYAQGLATNGIGVVVRSNGQTLSSTLTGAGDRAFPSRGTVSIGGTDYRAVTQREAGFGGLPIEVTVLSDLTSTKSSVQDSRLVAAIFIAGFLLLAFAFSVLSSRALQGQLGRFLGAARRLGSGDFSSPVPIEGRDEFAALGDEFNNMSKQLERRIDELGQERGRLRESIRRIGETFASNLDRPALLELALHTAADAVDATSGRVSARERSDDPLAETARIGSLDGLEREVYEAERAALGSGFGEAGSDGGYVASAVLRGHEPTDRAHGLITVVRNGRPLSDDDRDVLRSLASQTTLALENIELHYQVQRQAVTDELTGLANHRAFQELLTRELEQVRRYPHPVGLIMLDVDDFKLVNDTHGHPQGDVVLRQVAHIVRENSREADAPARYGGEEMALILPHTDVEGAYAIAERVRTAIEALRIPSINGGNALRVTVSVGVAASADGDKDMLISQADAALYRAKHMGKNRTVRAAAKTANVVGGE
jgi:diguanylate cyclase (GGDEF)-like protein